MPTQRELQDAVNALALAYAAQGGNPSAMIPRVPVTPPPMPGTYVTIPPIAGTAAIPLDVRPASLGQAPKFDPLQWVQGVNQVDPITGRAGQTVAQALQMAQPGPPVQKLGDGRPPPRVSEAYDPTVPHLTPLDAPLVAEQIVPPLPPNGPGYMSGYVKDNNARLLPGQPLDFIPPTVPQLPTLTGMDVPPIPMPGRPRLPGAASAGLVPGPGPSLTSQKPRGGYAGEPVPSLIPPADPGILGAMGMLARNPLAQLLALARGGGGGLLPVPNAMPTAAPRTPGAVYTDTGWMVPSATTSDGRDLSQLGAVAYSLN